MAEEITPQQVKTMAFAVFACTAVVLLVLLIDMRIAKNVVESAQNLDRKLKEYGRETTHRNPVSSSVPRSDSVDRVGRDPRMEARNHDEGVEAESAEESPWDVFPVSRPHGA